MHVPSDSLSKGLQQVFDGYLCPAERLLTGGLPALESHYEQLSRRLGFQVSVRENDLIRFANLMLENGKSADLKAMARTVEEKVPAASGLVHLLLLVAHFRANELDLVKEHYRVLEPMLQQAGWTPRVADWPKIVEAAKAGKNDTPGHPSGKGISGSDTTRDDRLWRARRRIRSSVHRCAP
jgi:hypothetical protein